jgi:type II secretion system protein H
MRQALRQFRLKRTGGFTLVELLIVMIIITLIVGAVAPKFAAFTAGRKAADGARQIVSLAQYAHTQAISEGKDYRLNVDATKKAFWITRENDGTFDPPPNDFGRTFVVDDSVQMASDFPSQTSGGEYVTFRPTGRSEPGSVTLTDRNGNSVVVMCPSATEVFHIAKPGEKEITVVKK